MNSITLKFNINLINFCIIYIYNYFIRIEKFENAIYDLLYYLLMLYM